MGKTYRNIKGAYNKDGSRNYKRRVEQPQVIIFDWAYGQLKPRIECWLSQMEVTGMIRVCDTDEYRSIFEHHLRKAISFYDPEKRNEDGRTASAMNYLRNTVENTANNIIESVTRLCRKGQTVFIVSVPCSEAKEQGAVSEEDKTFSDGCKSVKEMWLKMDVDTFLGTLTEEERRVFVLQYIGYTLEETAKEIYLSRRVISRRILPSIRRKARLCGFFTREDCEKGLNREELYK